MGLLNGTVTARRYRVTGELPGDFKDTLVRELPRHAFKEINPKINPEMSIGWVNPFDPLDTSLGLEKVLLGKYMLLGVRKDYKSVSGAIFRARLADAMRARSRERHGRRLTPPEISALKDEVKAKILESVSPATTLNEMVWNYETGDVYFSSLSSKASIEFMDLFEECFKLSLLEQTLPVRVEAYIDNAGLNLDLDSIDESAFVR